MEHSQTKGSSSTGGTSAAAKIKATQTLLGESLRKSRSPMELEVVMESEFTSFMKALLDRWKGKVGLDPLLSGWAAGYPALYPLSSIRKYEGDDIKVDLRHSFDIRSDSWWIFIDKIMGYFGREHDDPDVRQHHLIFWFTGRSGNGKTYLSEKLGHHLRLPILHLDSFGSHVNGRWLIASESLKKSVATQTQGGLNSCIIEGVGDNLESVCSSLKSLGDTYHVIPCHIVAPYDDFKRMMAVKLSNAQRYGKPFQDYFSLASRWGKREWSDHWTYDIVQLAGFGLPASFVLLREPLVGDITEGWHEDV